jgi:ACS family sodium-dependent inorganic phosphate cotransporter
MGLGVLLTAILTILTPSATYWGDANALIAIRFLMGLCEGVIQPAMSCLLAQWIPSQERSITGSLVYTGIRFGILVSSIISGSILGRYNNDWPFIFHLFGGIGVLWFLFWILLGYNSPREHPYITEHEKEYLDKQLEECTHANTPPFPWKYALTSKPFLALIIIQSGHDWSNYTIMSDLPKYMNNVLKLPVQLNGYASSMHNISSWLFCMAMSWFSDWLIVKGYSSRSNVRKINTVISTFGPGIMLVAAMYAGCNIIAAIALITIGLTLSGSSIPGIKVNVLDLSPNYAGTLMGISNGIGAFTGILAPYTVGVLAPNQTLSEWRLIFWIVAGVYVVTTIIFVIFASGDVQKWNDPAFFINKQTKCDQENISLSSKKKTNLSNKYNFYKYMELKYFLFIDMKSF